MRFLVSLFLSAALCASASAEAPKVVDADVEFLLTSAAKDFRVSNQPGTLAFRDVRVGRIPLSEGEINPLLCGEYQAAGKAWTPFATIKTDGYEQWNGGQGGYFCSNTSVVWNTGGDLTKALQSRFDTLK